MCGRYAFFAAPAVLKKRLKDVLKPSCDLDYAPHYNLGPGQKAPVLVHDTLGMAGWGFEMAQSSKLLMNARSETVASKPSFTDSWQKRRRCLVPANGFYEWRQNQQNTSAKKQPYYIYHKEDEILFFAGLWTKRKRTSDIRFTILTKEADSEIKSLHHRMPVIVSRQDIQAWFKGHEQDAEDLIEKSCAKDFLFHPVSPDVGNIRHNNENLIKEHINVFNAQYGIIISDA